MSNHSHKHKASFRDPSGYVFHKNGKYYRAVMPSYAAIYDDLVAKGVFQKLIQNGQLIAHQEVRLEDETAAYKTLLPEQIVFQTFPYEWSFTQLQDAALLTIDIALAALEDGYILKDASAYNIYFKGCQPQLLDSLSLAPYDESKGWVAFQQFCRHFLYPLIWMSQVPGIKPLIFLAYPDGIDIIELLRLAPKLSRFNLNNWLYVFMPAKVHKKVDTTKRTLRLNVEKQQQNLNHLRHYVAQLQPQPVDSTWNTYYASTILSNTYLKTKEALVAKILSDTYFESIVDIGANTGVFTKIAAQYAAHVYSSDMDAMCIDQLYKSLKGAPKNNIYPFVADMMQPSPASGFMNEEHPALLERMKADGLLALALVHHLRIANNVPWYKIFELFKTIAPDYVLVEFVEKSDAKVQELLATREDIFDDYTETEFLKVAKLYYPNIEVHQVPNSKRLLYVMRSNF